MFSWIPYRSFKTITIISILIHVNPSLASETIVHTPTNDPKEELITDILKLALSKTEKSGAFVYEEYPKAVTEGRLVELTKEGDVSVMWAGAQPKYEDDMYPIRIPILKGLLGHRIFIIRKGDQARFDKVETLNDLKEIKLGQGRHWGDTVVLKNAGLKVVDPVKYESLFNMLEGGRFDFFPRAVHEPWVEVDTRSELNLAVEESILLIYPFAMYFFVAHENRELGRLIETGFRKAIKDGSYDKLFSSHPMIRQALDSANLKNRKIFRLENPNMSSKTPYEDKSLWLDISKY